MTRFIAIFALLFLAVFTPLPAISQEPVASQETADDGPNRLARLLQNALSGAGRDVQIRGFVGALSSRAQIARMTIADDDGVWLTIEDVALDWNRSALLRGRVEVSELSAGRIALARLPKSQPEGPAPEAGTFALPDLPVSLRIDRIATPRLELGVPVLGEAAVLSLDAQASLVSAALDTRIDAERIDGAGGNLALRLAYSEAEAQLTVKLDLSEPEGGIAARALNIPGTPRVDLRIDGAGPLDGFTARMALRTAGAERLTGRVDLCRKDNGALGFDVDLGGDLTALLLPDARAFFGSDVMLTASGQRGDAGLEIARFSLGAAALSLEGALTLDARNRPSMVDLSGRIAAPGGGRVTLPFGDNISLAQVEISADFDAARGSDWTLSATTQALETPSVTANRLTLDARGQLELDGAAAFDGELRISGDPVPADAALARALGPQIDANAALRWQSGKPVTLHSLDLRLDTAVANANGTIATDGGIVFDGEISAQIADLAPFSGMAGRDLGGSVDAGLTGWVALPGGSFDLLVEARTEALSIDSEAIAPFITPETRLRADVVRGAAGLTLRSLTLRNPEIEVGADGTLSSAAGRLRYGALLRQAGRAAGGKGGDLRSSGRATYDGSAWLLEGNGTLSETMLGIAQADAALRGGGDISYRLRAGPETTTLETARLGNEQLVAQIEGALAPALSLRATLDVPQIGAIEPAITGAATLRAGLRRGDEGLRIDAAADLRDPRIGVVQVDRLLGGGASAEAVILLADGDLRISRAEIRAQDLRATLEGALRGGGVDLQYGVDLANLARVDPAYRGAVQVNGTLSGQLDGALASEGRAQLRSAGIGAEAIDQLLRGTGVLDYALTRQGDGTVLIRRARLDGTALSLDAAGKLVPGGAADLTLDARLDSLGRFVPQLPGPVSGQARLTGSLAAPDFDISVDGPQGLRLRSSGNVDPGDNRISAQLDAGMGNLAAFVPGLSGAIRARGDVSGAFTRPQLQLDLTGPAGTSLTIGGSYDTAAARADLTARGTVPLVLADPFLGARDLSGIARVDLALDGPLAPGSLSGNVSVENARFFDPSLGLTLTAINGDASLSGGRAQLALRARSDDGGLRINGPVGLEAPFRSDLEILLDAFPVERGLLLTTRLGGALGLRGGLTGALTLDGEVTLNRTEVRLVSVGSGAAVAIPDIDHRGVGADVRRTLERAGLLGSDGAGTGGGGPGVALNVRIRTGDPIFLRGRGVDAELNGALTLSGTVSDVIAQGQFVLTRGRLSILGQRLDFVEGRLSFVGALEPRLRLVAQSNSGDYTVQLTVEGPASDPAITVSAEPSLPQDEALAQLFFGRSVASLSPLQAARLAAAIAELAGDGGPGFLDRVRDQIGVDDLDIRQTDSGEAAVRAGKYIDDNVYTNVEVTSSGKTSLSINLDVGRNVVVKGSAASDGETGIGIFFEKDY